VPRTPRPLVLDLHPPDRVRPRDQVRADGRVGAALVVAGHVGAAAGRVEGRRALCRGARDAERVDAPAGRAARLEARDVPALRAPGAEVDGVGGDEGGAGEEGEGGGGEVHCGGDRGCSCGCCLERKVDRREVGNGLPESSYVCMRWIEAGRKAG